MSIAFMIDQLDLAALLCSRVCHDLISPSGAIVNGLEVLEEANDEETRTFALELIKKSARMASARLQFCRIAFGAAGSAGAQIDLSDAETVARGFIEDEKVKLAWNLPRALMPKNQVKLLLNMLLVATQSIPRGGMLTVDRDQAASDGEFKITARGLNARISEAVPTLLAGIPANGVVDAHTIQPFYAGLLARSSGLAVAIEMQGDTVVVAARESGGRVNEVNIGAAASVRGSMMEPGLAST